MKLKIILLVLLVCAFSGALVAACRPSGVSSQAIGVTTFNGDVVAAQKFTVKGVATFNGAVTGAAATFSGYIQRRIDWRSVGHRRRYAERRGTLRHGFKLYQRRQYFARLHDHADDVYVDAGTRCDKHPDDHRDRLFQQSGDGSDYDLLGVRQVRHD